MRLLLEALGLQGVGRSPARSAFEAQRATCRRPTSCLPTIISTARTASTRSASCGPIFGGDTAAILVTADRSTEVRAAAERWTCRCINKPVKPAALRSLITRMRRMTPAAAE